MIPSKDMILTHCCHPRTTRQWTTFMNRVFCYTPLECMTTKNVALEK